MAISDLTKEQIVEFSKESNSWKEFMIKCGYTNFGCRLYIKRKIELYDIDTAHFTNIKYNKKYSDEEIFKENSQYGSMTRIKNKLIKDYNWKYECSNCKLSEWMDQKIPIEVDHINGIHTDNRINNLRFLCPNCHALTDTYKGKNIKNKEHSKDKYLESVKNKKCGICNNIKYKYSANCKECHLKLNVHKIKNKKVNQCIDCNINIQKSSERCIDCYKKAKSNGIFEKQNNKICNTNQCPDCNKLISNTSFRCRLCHYNLMKSKTDINFKNKIKGKCVDCNVNIDSKAVRCTSCSNKIIEHANKKLSKTCIDCNTQIWNTAIRCVDCSIINSRKVQRPSYEDLIDDKKSMNMVQIGKNMVCQILQLENG